MHTENMGTEDAIAPSESRFRFFMSCIRCLYVSGQATDQIYRVTQRLADSQGVQVRLSLRWGEIRLLMEQDGRRIQAHETADPTGISMNRVAATNRLIEDVMAGTITLDDAQRRMTEIASSSSNSLGVFMLAAGAGASAMAYIYDVHHLLSVAIIFVSAALGALLRRNVTRFSHNALVPPFLAALLAGVIGAWAVYADISSAERLIALCPCMIMVPGPHYLNALLDIAHGRLHLGLTRLAFACIVIFTVSMGLVLGLMAFDARLPSDIQASAPPWYIDMTAAAVAIASFATFFSMPRNMLLWPVLVGTLCHGMRWLLINAMGMSMAGATFIACFIVGAILATISHRKHLPFAAAGFAAVVSMMPGIFLFSAASSFLGISTHPNIQVIIAMTANIALAFSLILAIGAGLLIPKMITDSVNQRFNW